ncbi:hypothetical protein HS088_TW21G01680 [Tripterygium wilfordii]|uniref:Uncharacterized protein n=1 Tax=Tripterygium wilfordii TaxID=458696 RepID=A0A7J7C5U0_TRIWF|nr:hypothetical protein HS088_TW21G01680 [Tripterygium wilfordii]
MPPRMELSEIKKRQSKRSPRPMFLVAEVSGDDGGAGRVNSGLLGPWRHRSLLLTVLAKASHGCIPRV